MDKNKVLMSFAEALKFANEKGFPIRRETWSGSKCVFLQIPATINADIVPKMTSLSERTKELILATAKKISYNFQAIEYNMFTGVATYYVPTIEDTLSKDWAVLNYSLQ